MTENKTESKSEVSEWLNYVAGGIGGLVVECAYFPIDTLKTRWQSTHLGNHSSKARWGLFSGIQATALAAFPVGFAYMAGFNWTSARLHTWYPEHFSNLLGGVVAEIMACMVRTPFEVVKQQMQVGLDPSVSKTISSIVKTRGVIGIYSGILPLLLRDAPYSAIFMPVYYALKSKSDHQQTVWAHLANCALAASLAVTVTQPMDVIKTRMMTTRGDKLTFRNAAKAVHQQNGFLGFYTAFSLRFLNAIYFAVVFMSVYEFASQQLQKRFRSTH